MSADDLRSGTWVTFAGGAAAAVRIRRCRLEVLAGANKGESAEIEASHIRIGARRGNDIQLSDSQVSGLHCEIVLEEEGYRLRDLDSTNGTFVGGYRVRDIYIHPGTTISLGATKIRFEPQDDSVELELSKQSRCGGMIGTSVKMRELFARVEKLAPSDATVLITGETGVGKELVAESMHELSKRAGGAFVVLDCSSIPQNLIESELFGHEKGSFTGASTAYAGAFERADGGTVFLDEIGELPLSMQPKLLRVLERKEVRRIGGSKTIAVDIRVVAATNRDLGVEVNRGRFREDLYYRLAVARIHVPPLRERRDDIPKLIEHFLEITPNADGTTLAPETIELMMKHDWPGNVRELRNVIERAVLLSEAPSTQGALHRSYVPGATGGNDIPEPEDRPKTAERKDRTETDYLSVAVDTGRPFKPAKQELITEFERRYVQKLLQEHGGNISAAARAAGIDRMSIHKMLNRLGLN